MPFAAVYVRVRVCHADQNRKRVCKRSIFEHFIGPNQRYPPSPDNQFESTLENKTLQQKEPNRRKIAPRARAGQIS